jgi:hypothetical protein
MKYALTLVLFLLAAIPGEAQTLTSEAISDIAKSRTMINDKRNTALAFNMTFTDPERLAFWPLYTEFRDAMTEVGNLKLEVIIDYAENYGDMTESKAAELLDRYMSHEEQALHVKQQYIEKFREILPASKVTRLFQIENRMDAAITLKLAEGIPLME